MQGIGRRVLAFAVVLLAAAGVAVAANAGGSGITVSKVVDVSNDTTSQNETPLAINPANPQNMITGDNDWNFNDGCGVNATFDGGKTWTAIGKTGFHSVQCVGTVSTTCWASGTDGRVGKLVDLPKG